MVDPVCRLGEHQLPDVATSSGSLNKSLAGFREILDPTPKDIALLVTNTYKTMFWPNSQDSMALNGAIQDRGHVRQFLKKVGFSQHMEILPIDDARREDIVYQVKQAIERCPRLLVAYFQGHGDPIHGYNSVRYITSDQREDGTLDGLTAEDLIKLFCKLNTRTVSVVITDFCHSGNVYRLPFILDVRPDGSAFWLPTQESEEDSKMSQAFKVTSPMLHIAGSLRKELVYETEIRGGYATNSLAQFEGGPMTLSQFLLGHRQRVNNHLGHARAYPGATLDLKKAEQAPQIYSNYPWPLHDCEVFSKIHQGAIPASD